MSVIDADETFSGEFMENLVNPEIGGFYSIVREGQTERAARIVSSVRARFDQMWIIKVWMPLSLLDVTVAAAQ